MDVEIKSQRLSSGGSTVHEITIWDEWARAVAERRAADASLALLASGVSDWTEWGDQARAHGLAAAIWQAACQAGVQQIFPPDVAAVLESEAIAHSRLKQEVREAAAAAGRVLDAARLEWMLLGLPGSVDLLPGRRETAGRANLLIRQQDLGDALSALEGAGWSPDDVGILERESRRLRLSSSPVGDLFLQDMEWVWERAAELDLGRYRVKTPGGAQMAVISALSAFFDHHCRPAACLLDLAQALSSLDRRARGEIQTIAGRAGVLPEVGITLRIAHLRQGVRLAAGGEELTVARGSLRSRAAIRALYGGEAEQAVHRLLTASDGATRDALVESLLARRGRGGPGAIRVLGALIKVLFPSPLEQKLWDGGNSERAAKPGQQKDI
ncbi:MAG: hypothetical protein KatS3mg024_0864 [Armatimonadota bacterium]|nr:MAG: hypothetical protein KatS3mg024_0864 [Armatimonadota bacterium]